MSPDYFEFLGLEKRLKLDEAELQKRFYDLSRQLHPDRFARRSAAEQQNALDSTALLNDAYRTLRDPIQRAEYMLKREGLDIGEQRSKDVPPELLEEVFELNMALEEMRNGDASGRQELQQARDRFSAMLRDADAAVQQEFGLFDQTQDAAVLQNIRGILNRRRYLRNLLNEVEKALATPST